MCVSRPLRAWCLWAIRLSMFPPHALIVMLTVSDPRRDDYCDRTHDTRTVHGTDYRLRLCAKIPQTRYRIRTNLPAGD